MEEKTCTVGKNKRPRQKNVLTLVTASLGEDGGNELKMFESTNLVPGGSDLCCKRVRLHNDAGTKQNALRQNRQSLSPTEVFPGKEICKDFVRMDDDLCTSLNYGQSGWPARSDKSLKWSELFPTNASVELSTNDYVASSNPASPQMFPVGKEICKDFVRKDDDPCTSLSYQQFDSSSRSQKSLKWVVVSPTKSRMKLSMNDYIPSSNPSSPQVVPMEGKQPSTL